MDLQRINLKISLAEWEVSEEEMFKTFNQWISTDTDEILIDVADYRHVHDGPETLLVGHYSNYSIDRSGGTRGLLYCQKRGLEGTLGERIEKVFSSTLDACRRLEKEPELDGRVRFSGAEAVLTANDRLLAPNNESVRGRIREDLDPLLARLYGGAGYSVEIDEDETHRARASFHIVADGDGSVEEMLNNLNAG